MKCINLTEDPIVLVDAFYEQFYNYEYYSRYLSYCLCEKMRFLKIWLDKCIQVNLEYQRTKLDPTLFD